MKYILMRTLLSEMRAAEVRCLEVVRCQRTRKDRAQARICRKRIRAYDELKLYVALDDTFPVDEKLENTFRAALDRITKDGAWVKNHSYDHVFVHDEDIMSHLKTRAS